MKLIIHVYILMSVATYTEGDYRAKSHIHQLGRDVNALNEDISDGTGTIMNALRNLQRRDPATQQAKKATSEANKKPPKPAQRYDKCDPCVCEGATPIFVNYPKACYAWRNHKVNWRRLYCPNKARGKLIGNIPGKADKNLEIIEISKEPFCQKDQGILKKRMFERFTNLQLLACYECGATSIEQDILSPHRKNLKEIYFGHNSIRDLPVGIHQHAPLLQIADWRYTGIEVLPAGSYTNLQNFKWACHHNNRLKTVEAGAFKNLPALEFVGLEYNMLTFMDVKVFDNYKFAENELTSLLNNRFFCNMDLCPFLDKIKKCLLAYCFEPKRLAGKVFKNAIPFIGTQAVAIRHQVESGGSARLSCTTCGYGKLKWQKLGTGDIGKGTLPAGCRIEQAAGSHTTDLVIQKATQEEHNGNYSCFSPECITADCPIPVISLTVTGVEPVWNLTGGEGAIDDIVRHGSVGVFSASFPVFIYSIIMTVCMSAFWIYYRIKKKHRLQQQPQQQEQQERPQQQEQKRETGKSRKGKS